MVTAGSICKLVGTRARHRPHPAASHVSCCACLVGRGAIKRNASSVTRQGISNQALYAGPHEGPSTCRCQEIPSAVVSSGDRPAAADRKVWNQERCPERRNHGTLSVMRTWPSPAFSGAAAHLLPPSRLDNALGKEMGRDLPAARAWSRRGRRQGIEHCRTPSEITHFLGWPRGMAVDRCCPLRTTRTNTSRA